MIEILNTGRFRVYAVDNDDKATAPEAYLAIGDFCGLEVAGMVAKGEAIARELRAMVQLMTATPPGAFVTYRTLREAVSPTAAARLAGRAAKEAKLDRDACPKPNTGDEDGDLLVVKAWLMGWDEQS